MLGAPLGAAAQDVPSNKLFFAGLPSSLTEETFKAMMEKFPGFEAARLRHDRAGQWVGFVDFSEETEATACKNAMAGAKLDPNASALVTVRYSGQKNQQRPNALTQGGPLAGGKRAFEPSFEPPPPPGPPPGWNGPMPGGFDGPMGGPGPMGGMGVPLPGGPPPGMMGGPMGMNGDAPLPPGPPPGMMAANAATPLPPGPPPGAAGGGSRVLIVEGLPADGTKRELTQLFRFLPGFVSISDAPEESKEEGEGEAAAEEAKPADAKRYMVEFVNASDASGAIAVRQGMLFDPAQPTTSLKVGFAPAPSA